MIDKLNTQINPPRTTKVDKTEASNRTSKKTQSSAKTPLNADIISEIVKSIDYEAVTNGEDLQKEMIVKALSRAFGEKFAATPQFKILFDKIDDVLSDDDKTQQKLRRIIDSKKSAE